MMKITNLKVLFTKYAENQEARVNSHKELVVYGSQSHSKTRKSSTIEKAHASSEFESHIRHLETAWAHCKGGYVNHCTSITTYQGTWANQKLKHHQVFLCKQHVPHRTNFDKLIDHIVSCGGKNLDEFVRQQKNVSYTCTSTSSDAVTGFVEAIGIVWIYESLVNRFLDAQLLF